jgi:hypothetical protein
MNNISKNNSLASITKIDTALAITGLYFSLSGILIQVKYHMHGRSKESLLLGMDYTTWNALHVISSLLGLVLISTHIYQHRKWYMYILKSRKIPKQKPTFIISIIFFLMVLTGLTPLTFRLIDPVKFAGLRFMFIEVHDKLGILLSILLTGHILRRLSILKKNIGKTLNTKKTPRLYSGRENYN